MATKVMQQNNVAETLIGAIVVAVAVLFLAFAYMRTGSGSLSGYDVRARLAKVDGLGVGTDVRVSGIKIGTEAPFSRANLPTLGYPSPSDSRPARCPPKNN